jgi:hypothetical protein
MALLARMNAPQQLRQNTDCFDARRFGEISPLWCVWAFPKQH